MRVAVIGNQEMVLGFALAGVKRVERARTPGEAEGALHRCLQDADIGVIFVSEQLAEGMRATITARERKGTMYPLIIEVPGKEGPIGREDPMRKIVRTAVGVDVRQRVCRRD